MDVYQEVFDSFEKNEGAIDAYALLWAYSTAKDEPKLLALRQCVLEHGLNETFYDFQKINWIIVRNRLAEHLKPSTPGKNGGEK